ncbi:MAG: phosphodiesterase [Gammaproteobacteria bacterium]|nr:phosphodiesterase [Gammaproteobacteria bacterium]
MKFIHFTDPHLVTPGEKLHGIDPLQRMQECLAHIATNQKDAEFCVITGDLADRGEPEAYQALHDELAKFPLKTYLILGNHDHRENFFTAFPNKTRDEIGFVQSCLQHEFGDFLFLDTLDQGQRTGLYCGHRQAWLSNCLSETKDRDVYLFLHHPPFPIGIPPLDDIALSNPREFAEVLRTHDRIKYLFFGHVHRPVNGSWHGVPFSTLFGTNHQVALSFESDEVISYSLEPPAYNIVLLEQDRTVIHTCNYQDESAWRPDRRPTVAS